MGILERLKKRLVRTRTALSDRIAGLFRGGREMDDTLLGELEELLYTADLGAVAVEVVGELQRRHRRGEVHGEADVRASLRTSLLERLQSEGGEPQLRGSPTVILIVGVNGSGKTTTLAKLAYRFAERGQRVLIGACDTFRAAAADQLAIWAERIGVELVRKDEGADPAAVAYEAIARARESEAQIVLLDTAGRLHTHKNLMAELAKVHRVAGKLDPEAPHEVWLVLDATNGQNAIQQAKLFREAVPVTGLVVAKLDGTARGGALFSIQRELELPVRYIGTGETLEDLEVFEPEAFVDAVLAG